MMRNLSRWRAEGVVSRQIIERPRSVRTCDASYCFRHTRRMEVGEPRLRLFGAAFSGCRPYAIYIHPECEAGALDSRLNIDGWPEEDALNG